MIVYDEAFECDMRECGVCGNRNEMGDTHCAYCSEPLELAMHKVYIEKSFSADHMDIISKSNEFMRDYEAQGFKLSLRQLYYQFVATVPGFANTDASYKRLGGILTHARYAGLVPFEGLEDRGRKCEVPNNQTDPAATLEHLQYRYGEDMWEDQDTYVEVWVEKDALSSVIERPCNRLRVPFMACKGYMSSSAQYEAGKRFLAAHEAGKRLLLLHLGDHDPSGIDMTADNKRRLELFTECRVDVRRIALTREQIEEHNPPPNPAKVTDSRAKAYIAEHGDTSWELDALRPAVIDKLISSELTEVVDPARWNAKQALEEENRKLLRRVETHAAEVFDFVKNLED